MPCNHGLDEANCPICRMRKHTFPQKFIERKKPRENSLKPETLKFKKNMKMKNTLKHKLPKKKEQFEGLKLINSIPSSPFLNEIPEFKNRMFEARLKEIAIGNPDNFGISEKEEFTNPELDMNAFKKKEK